ncbi:MAG: hypothetical protein H6732_14290 [Alphaproteobacteria bacterium]|nr:hypothetical protein [Alphaproteobacteria bacterium]
MVVAAWLALVVGCSSPVPFDAGGLQGTGASAGDTDPDVVDPVGGDSGDEGGPDGDSGDSAPPADTGGDTGSAHTDASGPVDCAPLDAAGLEVCASRATACDVVTLHGETCDDACALAGLTCGGAWENVDGYCLADFDRAQPGCASGHQSDLCVCVAPTCAPDCGGRSCGSDGCGGTCGSCAGHCTEDGTCEVVDRCALGLCGLPARCAGAKCKAFPGAEGEGAYAEGGRTGDVYHVTTLADAGAGSLRTGLSGSGARTIVFDVGGVIALESDLRSSRSRLTLAGQTAPGHGITVRNFGLTLTGDDVVVRHLHFRSGDTKKKTASRPDGHTEDSLTFNGSDVIIDHVSASWGIDESLSGGSGDFDRVTIQYCIIAEGLRYTNLFHGQIEQPPNGHSMGSLVKAKASESDVSLHHNLWISNGNRNPAVGTYEDTQAMDADIRNNVVYNCRDNGYVSGVSKRVRVNYVGNYVIWGKDSDDDSMFDGNADSNVSVWASDNRLDRDEDGKLDGSGQGWNAISGSYKKLSAAHPMEPVTTESVTAAVTSVLDGAGAFPWKRDPVDARLVAEVRTWGTGGRIIDSVSDVGGQPSVQAGTRVVDSDGDGLPDDFEALYGTKPGVADGHLDVDGDGWTNLDAYLHWAASR